MQPGLKASHWWPMLPIIVMIGAGFILTIIIFYPGIMTYDARYIHSFIAEDTLGDWQSPLMTMLWAVIDPIAPGAASMFLLIAALYWILFAILALAILPYSKRVAFIVPLLGLTPPAFMLAGIIWRDILFAEVWLLAATIVFVTIRCNPKIRLPAQAFAILLFLFGFLLRPNALLAAPILGAYLIWPEKFYWRRVVILYVPMVIALYAVLYGTYYKILDVKREHPLHSIFVFDLAGITHFTKENQFPVSWTPEQTKLLTDSCYQPVEWNIYWINEPCRFVMEKLESDKIFGTTTLVRAWMQAVAKHPIAYIQHRNAVTWQFLSRDNLTIWLWDLDDPHKTVFPDRAAFHALVAIHDILKTTPLFRVGLWLLVCIAGSAFAWSRRNKASGAFIISICGSAAAYLISFWPFAVAVDFRYAYWAVLAGIAGNLVLRADIASRKA